MKIFAVFFIALGILTAPAVRADEYTIDNGYISLHGSGGAIRDLRVDPSGKGAYGPIILREAYVGDRAEDSSNVPFEIADNTVTLKNVRIYCNPREVGLNEWDTPVRLEKGQTLGQLFAVDKNGMASVEVMVPTWQSAFSAMTLKLYSGGPAGKLIAEKRFENVPDNSWCVLTFPAQLKGTFYLEMSDPRGPVGWYSSIKGKVVGRMYENGNPMEFGARAFKAKIYDVFPAQVKISAVGSKLFAEVVPDDEKRRFNWSIVTPFVRDGYETHDPAQIAFSHFISDRGQYIATAQLKRRGGLDFGVQVNKWIYAAGNGGADMQFSVEGGSLSFAVDTDSLTFKLGKALAVSVKPHSDTVPDFYPAFFTSDPSFDKSLNSFFYERAFSWPVGGVNPDWFEWMALIHFWNYRPTSLEYWRQALLTHKIDEDGYVYTWGDNKGWPFPDNTKYDPRHFTTNPNFILACYRYYAWTKDREFLQSNIDRIRSAMNFMLIQLKGSDGIITLPDKDHGGTTSDVASNYWDDLPFGGISAYENAYFYASLGAMASVESALGNADKAKDYNDLREKCRKRYNELFWNDKAGRYIGCIDKNGTVHDYGFTYVNTEAATYGLPDKSQVERIYHWMEQEKTSSGKTDTYSRYRFAPRVNTIDCKGWWYLNGKAEIPSQQFDTHLENGGAVLYTSGYDVMARAKYLGADNAFKRFKDILARYNEPDNLCGGVPLRYGENTGWQVGTDQPFPESGLAPVSFLYAFLGIQATADGLMITPNLPTELKYAGVKNLRYRGLMLEITETRTSINIRCEDPAHKINVQKNISPGDGYLFADLEKG